MPDATTRIGPQLREARIRRGLTMQEVADAANLTKGFLSQVERDLTSASVASLVRLCAALGIEIGSLFEKPLTNYVPKSARREVRFGDVGVTEHLLSPSSEQRIQVIEQSIKPGGRSGEEPYALPGGETEFVHVVRGELEVTIGEQVYRLGSGDSLTFSARDPHSWRNPSNKPTHAIWALSPAVF